MKLNNTDLQLQLLDLEGKYREAEESLTVLARSGLHRSGAISQLDVAREIRDSARKQWEEKKGEFEKLTIVAPAGGTIIPPPSRTDKISLSQGRLPTWEGTPFDERNRGALLTPTDLICQIGDPRQMDAVLIVDQAYIDLIKNGQQVRVLLEAYTRQGLRHQDRRNRQHGSEICAGRHVHAAEWPPGNQGGPLGTNAAAQYVVSGPRSADRFAQHNAGGHAGAGPDLHRMADAGASAVSLLCQDIPL